MNFEQWNGFVDGEWRHIIDVRDFIQRNYTPYHGDDAFLKGATERTKNLTKKFYDLCEEEKKAGGVLDIDTETVASLCSYAPGYLDKENEINNMCDFKDNKCVSHRENNINKKSDYLLDKRVKMPKYYWNVEQGTPEWDALRLGKFTASSFHTFLGKSQTKTVSSGIIINAVKKIGKPKFFPSVFG